MTQKFAKGTWVAWNWGNGTPTGKVVDHSTDRIEKTIDGSKQSRNGTEDNPPTCSSRRTARPSSSSTRN